jgi:hypothetical protein
MAVFYTVGFSRKGRETYMKMGSLRTKLVALFLAAALLPMTVLGVLFYSKSVESLSSTVAEELVAVSNKQVEFIRYWLGVQQSNLRLMASTEDVKSFDLNRVTVYFKEMLKQCPDFQTFYLIGPDGVSVIQSDGNSGIDVSEQKYFKDALQMQDSISEVMLSGKNNIVVIGTPYL